LLEELVAKLGQLAVGNLPATEFLSNVAKILKTRKKICSIK
jgi:hypothetical protein